MKSADSLTVSSSSVRANEALRSSESERRRRDESSGGVLSSETVKVYVPDSAGVKDGRTARIVEAESDLRAAADEEEEEGGQMIVTPLLQVTLLLLRLGQLLKFSVVSWL